MIHKCNNCEYQTPYKANYRRHIQNKHGIKQPHVDSDPVVPMEQTAPSHSQNEMHSNLQEESMDQLYKNIDQWQKAYETLKEQYQKLQQEEKVTTCNDGRPSHVSIQLYDKCCNVLKANMGLCERLRTEKERLWLEKGQQLDRFCTAWEDLKWERDAFAKEIIRRECCGEGVLSKKFARKLRRQMLRNPNIMKN